MNGNPSLAVSSEGSGLSCFKVKSIILGSSAEDLCLIA